jgi:hypothetical protein
VLDLGITPVSDGLADRDPSTHRSSVRARRSCSILRSPSRRFFWALGFEARFICLVAFWRGVRALPLATASRLAWRRRRVFSRSLMLLVDLFGYSSEQAARILKVRPSIVRNLASQARRTLRASEVARDA